LNISLVVAVTENNVIGWQGGMPWHLPADLRYFKQITLHKPVVMGRVCFESIGKPLVQRHNVILTRDSAYSAANCTIVHSVNEVLAHLSGAAEMMVIGGAQIYQQFLSMAHRLYLTRIHADLPGDTFFPAWDNTAWQQVSSQHHVADSENPYDYSFLVYERI